MGFLDWITGKIECPRCGTGGARKIKGQVYCSNPTCSNFSKTMGKGDRAASSASSMYAKYGEATEDAAVVFSDGPAIDTPAGAIAIQYRNFRGEVKTFVTETASIRRQRNHLSVNVAKGTRMVMGRNPQTGEPQKVRKEHRIVLSRERILNLAEVEGSFTPPVAANQNWPTPRERQVLNYHKRHRSTSPLYESIRARYPNW